MHAQLGLAVDAIWHLARYAAARDLPDADELLTEILAILLG